MRLIIEERRAGHPDHEEALLVEHAATLGIPVERMSWKPFVRQRVTPDPCDIVSGSVKFVRAALQSLGKELPPHDPYPHELWPWLHRRVWRGGPVADVLASAEAVFIKPEKRWKRFTGFVVDQPNPPQLYNVSKREPVWCSEVVKWLSEWRSYVVDGAILFTGLAPSSGNRRHAIDLTVVQRAVDRLDEPPGAYAIDFGLLATGETALIEMNDGFSVGAYDGIPADAYFRFVATRWNELADGQGIAQ